jgi:hypothetical protein
LQGSLLLTRAQKGSLGEFLASCDLIKFAKYEPTEMELRGLYQSAVRLVNETEPRLAPANVPPPIPNKPPAAPPTVARQPATTSAGANGKNGKNGTNATDGTKDTAPAQSAIRPDSSGQSASQ